MNNAERLAAEAAERVAGWASLSPEDRQAVLAVRPVNIRELRAGGAVLSVNGVDQWCPSRRHAEDQAAALTES